MHQNRPLSPHLQVYKLPPTGIVSITHRITGVLLALGLLFVGCIVSALAGGQESFEAVQSFAAAAWVRVLIGGFIFALFFHLCHGVRHLVWDAGYGFDAAKMNRLVGLELAASLVLTALVSFGIFAG